MITAFLILAVLSTQSGATATTTLASTIYFCSSSLCIVPSTTPSGIYVNQTFYVQLQINYSPFQQKQYIQNTQVGFETNGQTIIQASNQFTSESGKNYIIFGISYPNISSNVQVNIYGNLVSTNIFYSNPGYIANATSNSFSVTNYAQIFMASSLIAFILVA